GPFEEDRAGVVEPARREAEAAERDERVPSPVGEPRVAGDDRLAAPAPDEIGVGGAVETGGKLPATLQLGRADSVAPLGQIVSLGSQRPDRLAAREVPSKDSGRPEVLDVIETAGALLGVEEVAIPVGLVGI